MIDRHVLYANVSVLCIGGVLVTVTGTLLYEGARNSAPTPLSNSQACCIEGIATADHSYRVESIATACSLKEGDFSGSAALTQTDQH